MSEFEEGKIEHCGWAEANLGIWSGAADYNGFKDINPKNIIGFCHSEQSFSDRITGLYDGGCAGDKNLPEDKISSLWAEAGNIVQWLKKA